MNTLKLGDIRYNAMSSAFEARVDIISDSGTRKFPCHVKGPLDMDMKRVRAGLERQAQRMSTQGSPLMSHI